MTLTPEQFNKLATKEDLKKVDTRLDNVNTRLDSVDTRLDNVDTRLDKLAIEQIKTRESLKNFATKDDLNKKSDEILTAVDAVVKKLDVIEHAFVSNLAAHDRFEKRIARIEKHLNLGHLFSA